MSEETDPTITNPGNKKPHKVRLPGFIVDDEIGLGEALKKVTTSFGLKPCGGCAQRAATLDRWLVFSNKQRGT